VSFTLTSGRKSTETRVSKHAHYFFLARATLVDYELGENVENEFNIDSDSLNKIVVHQTIAMSWFTRTGSRPKPTLSSKAKGF
jgi:hypothetical protein